MSKVIGLTGPVAAGKDEVAAILRWRGAHVIDADEVAHSLYGVQSPIWQEIVRTFGSKVLMRGGKINRKKLGEIVFSDKKKLQALNRIVHPRLKEEIIKQITDHRTQSAEHGLIIVNAAVLKEIGLVPIVDEVWVVTASRPNRLKRLLKGGLSKDEALARINSQSPQKDYLKMADAVIRNDGTLKQLNDRVQARF